MCQFLPQSGFKDAGICDETRQQAEGIFGKNRLQQHADKAAFDSSIYSPAFALHHSFPHNTAKLRNFNTPFHF